ncbi:MAG TPA: fused MFS/spermidine synthase [Cryptosporangiaceae bacterium]|nr:fused MFS/spermidine synthase [Cryptosporangiaceae bacterium]
MTRDPTGAADARAGRATLGPRATAALVFLAAGAVLVLEILSLRLIAPYVGLTLETNTAVIGIALAAIATGAWLGGRTADLVPPDRLLGPLVLAAGGLVFAVLPLVRWTGEWTRGGDTSAVLLIAAVAVFAPAALLSAVTPIAVKLRLGTLSETGTVVGRLSGIGTAGAIAATFGTGFVLVAMVPSSVILLGLGGVLVVVGLVLTVRFRGVRSAAAPLVLVLVAGGATLGAPQPCDVETAYHCARVVADTQRPTGRLLELDTLRHSYVDLADPGYLRFSYVRAIASGIDVFYPDAQPVRALHLGAGGLTLPRYLADRRPGGEGLVFEIDRGVLELDRARLDADRIPDLTTRVVDARRGLASEPDASRDLVVGDAFGGIAVPWHLTTRELVADVRRVLVDGGLYAVNVIDFPPLAFARAEIATIATQFRHVAVVARPDVLRGEGGGNLVVFASDAPLPLEALRDRLAERSSDLAVLAGADDVTRYVDGAPVLTDDFAPVDQLLTPYPTR